MTIDERLEKLAAHHEALSHTVELIAQMHLRTERELRRFARLARMILIDHEERLRDLEPEENDDDQQPKP